MSSPINEFDLMYIGPSFVILALIISGINLGPTSFAIKTQLKIKTLLLTIVLCLIAGNLLGLVKFGIPLNCYPVLTIICALLLWSNAIIIWFYLHRFKFWKTLISNNLPIGTPINIWILLPILEVVRVCVQPLTLLLRITANLWIGHFLFFFRSKLRITLSLILRFLLLWFEIFVRIVQSLVFLILITIYQKYWY
jgi:F0F1-type ATP synthase membrane subunit a